jgi:iron complex transport system substrate-binding protein
VATEIVVALGHGRHLVAVDAVSARIPGLQGLPVTEVLSTPAFAPDLLLVPADQVATARRALPRVPVVEVAPHDFDEAWDLYRAIGKALGQEEEAQRYVREISRPLAEIGARSFGKQRPRVVAVLALDPLEIAGGHSFVTDLIELAGGESVSHGTEEPRLQWSPEAIARARPGLALLVLGRTPSPQERERASRLLPAAVRIEVLALDTERFWLEEPAPVVERVRAWLDPLRGPEIE